MLKTESNWPKDEGNKYGITEKKLVEVMEVMEWKWKGVK